MAFVAVRPLVFSQRFRLSRAAATANVGHVKTQQRGLSLDSYVVTPNELHNALRKNAPTKISTAPRVVPVCAAWFMPNDPEGRKGVDVFKKKRIPHARFFDLDGVKDPTSPYPHMLPNKEQFAEAMRTMGIRRDDEVVVYDTEEQGLLSAPRVGWTFKFFGHPNVHVLNNFKLWVKEGYPTESGDPAPVEATSYEVHDYNPKMVVHFEEMKEIAQDHGKEGSDGIQILDARPYGRWAGTAGEPRPGLPSGHMPGSKSIPFGELLDPETKALLPAAELRKYFVSKGIDPTGSVITTCGSGTTAAVIDLALNEAGYGDFEDRRLYDGSWT